jgi:23S rRNA (uracil1939-C5)-methyltransferase
MLPTCRHFPACGGCQILDLEYPEQLLAKEEELRRHFLEWPELLIEPILPSPHIYGYRHKVQLPFGLEGRGKEWKDMKRKALGAGAPAILATLGCFAAGSHEVVDQEECLVQDAGLSQVAWTVRDWANTHALPVYREATGEGWLRHLLLRKGAGTGEIILGLVTNGPGINLEVLLPDLVARLQSALTSKSSKTNPGQAALTDNSRSKNELVGIVQSINIQKTNVVLGGEEKLLWGRAYLKENLGALTFSVGVSTFFQVNPFQIPRLYDLALAGISTGSAVLDLYSGMGSIALWVSGKAKTVLGIEFNTASVAAARLAAKENGIENVEFVSADVAQALTDIKEGNERGGSHADPRHFDTAIVDPPRKGLEVKVKEAMLEMGLKKIVYVSCYPPTLARDAKDFSDRFKLVSLSPVDMFPHTRHVECVAVFEAR